MSCPVPGKCCFHVVIGEIYGERERYETLRRPFVVDDDDDDLWTDRKQYISLFCNWLNCNMPPSDDMVNYSFVARGPTKAGHEHRETDEGIQEDNAPLESAWKGVGTGPEQWWRRRIHEHCLQIRRFEERKYWWWWCRSGRCGLGWEWFGKEDRVVCRLESRLD